MKRFLILAVALLAVSAAMLTVPSCQESAPVMKGSYHQGGAPPREYWVLATDSTDQFRRGGPGVYWCDGTDDWEQIQDAVDAAEASGWLSATVRLSDGHFDFDTVPSDQTVYGGVCTVDNSGATSVLTVTSWDGSYSMSDVTVGDVIRLSHDGAGTDPGDDNDDLCFTVTAQDATTITLAGKTCPATIPTR